MPEDAYSFKPSPELQDFGQRVAHMAAMIGTCSRVKGGEPKQSQATGKTSKADLVAALKAASTSAAPRGRRSTIRLRWR